MGKPPKLPIVPLSPTLIVREARVADYGRLCALYEELDRFHRDARPDVFVKPAGPPRSREHVASLIDGKATTILIAQSRGEVAGFAALSEKTMQPMIVRRSETYIEIDELAVAENHRRRGVARKLLRAAEDWACRRGVDTMRIGVWYFNEAARSLYATEGFEPQTLRLTKRLTLTPSRKGRRD